jgi:hypothetical protein
VIASLRPWLLPLAAAVVAGAVVAAIIFALSDGSDDSADRTPTPDPETDSSSLPGTFVSTQGRGHFGGDPPGRTLTPFCKGVATFEKAGEPSVAVPTPQFGEQNDCYASNPPTSGWHLGAQRNVEVAPGARVNLPPDPDVYPPDIEIPRDAIPHILEHAGVFVGYHCDDGDAACEDVVDEVTRIVNDRIDNHNDRVVMARDSDLPPGMIGVVSWTRIDVFDYGDFTEDRVVRFIDAHSCRFDPEGFCEGSSDSPVRGEGVETE